jgi:xylan 1,4-beta-xylosidase
LRVYCDGTAITGAVAIPTTGGWTTWRTTLLKNLNLPAGYHTLRLETVEGEFDFSNLQFESGATEVPGGSDNFNSGNFSSTWNYSNGIWNLASGRAAVTINNGYAKKAMGNVGWTDYTVEADVQVPASGNGGLIFRVRNPAGSEKDTSNAVSSNFLQGYYAGIETGGIVLGKHNYNWATLAYKTQALTAGQSYKLRAVLNGENIKIYLNDMATPVIDYTDTHPIISGKAGIRAHNAVMTFDNFLITPNTGALMVLSK